MKKKLTDKAPKLIPRDIMDCTRQQHTHLSVLLILLALISSMAIASENSNNTPPSTLEPLDCVINPSVVADLGSSVPGVLRSVLVDRSDFIQSGEIVAQLDSGIDTASLELARARASLTAEIDLRRINAAFGQRQNKRVEDLFSKQVISSKDMDQTETETKLTQLQLRQAKDNRKLAQLELLRAQEVLDRLTIRSPITGVIMDRFKTIGEYVDDQPIVRVAQLSPLHVEVIIPVEQLGKVQKGMLADVWSEAVGGKWQARVSRVDRVADVASGTYGVRLTLDNPDYKIPAGLRCRVNFLPQKMNTESASANSKTPAAEKETETTPVAPVATALDIDKTPPEGAQCTWLGPFTDEAMAQQKAAAIQTQGINISVQQRSEKEQTGIKVMSPAFNTKTEVNAYLQKLRAQGDKDHFLLKKVNNEPYQISLGLYAGPESAELRAKQLKKKGFNVIIEPRYIQQTSHWLLLNGNLSQLDEATQQAIADTSQTSQSSSCDGQASR